MAVAHCIVGKFLGVVYHCFLSPLPFPTFAAMCLDVCNDVRDPSSERWNWGQQRCPVILPKLRLPHKFMDLLHAATLWHGSDDFTPPVKEGVLRIFCPKNPTVPAGFDPANLGTKDQHATPRPQKPIIVDTWNVNKVSISTAVSMIWKFYSVTNYMIIYIKYLKAFCKYKV